ncbi:hypothetical protein QFC22_004734 [Naganishia vaughanmartiniae]|uniref:Uncharacterized protein n=1 Tax=Naganishia vaughanmartiniae TaxID=1424756 RepID=A0ACC2WYW4_9TREE|nr:hypothetical protein QFC22_004734 [Naganishia vaughanmartiniae]
MSSSSSAYASASTAPPKLNRFTTPLLPGQFNTETYFSSQPPPPDLQARLQPVKEFVERWRNVEGKRVVVVTKQTRKSSTIYSGTYHPTNPFLLCSVRFLDNFSAGTRGSTSAEYFLSHPTTPYAVIFMHRQHSLRPFSRHYSHSLNPFLDLLTCPPPADIDEANEGDQQQQQITVNPSKTKQLLPVLRAYHASHHSANPTICSLEFVTVNDYLWLLKELAEVVKPLGSRAMFYLAAAVSDFFLPQDRVAEHKIQSTRGNLTLEMDQVPKVLRPLVQEWIPEAFIVSFKLETDQALLIPKAQKALERYGHQVVVGNDLHRRKMEVVLVELDSASSSTADDTQKESQTSSVQGGGQGKAFKQSWLRLAELQEEKKRQGVPREEVEGVEIEEMIVRRLVERHDQWLVSH